MLSERSYTRITLALDIIRRLTEGEHAGYHELNSLKHQISLYDVISVEPSRTMRITCDDSRILPDASNLCWRAASAVKEECGVGENVHIVIEKHIPVGGGLAGGSANAATVVRLLDRLWDLRLSVPRMSAIGRAVGMDVPYYFVGGTVFDTEATAVLEPVATGVLFDCILCIPPFGIATAEAYRMVDYAVVGQEKEKTEAMRRALCADDRERAISLMHNDFERPVSRRYPVLTAMKEDMIRAGCINACLSGSGSTLVGIARDAAHARQIIRRLPHRCLFAKSIGVRP